MAKVKLTASLSGSRGSWRPGEEYTCGDKEAARLIAAGFAVAIPSTSEGLGGQVEERVRAPEEAAVSRGGRRGRR